jgi:hypothetical protein
VDVEYILLVSEYLLLAIKAIMTASMTTNPMTIGTTTITTSGAKHSLGK